MTASARTTIGQLSIGRKFATIITPTGKRRLNAKLSAGLRRMKPTEEELGKVIDDGVRAALAVELVKTEVWLPADVLPVAAELAKVDGLPGIDAYLGDCLRDLVTQAGHPCPAGTREGQRAAYRIVGKRA